MPYIIRKHSGKHKVYRKSDSGQPTGNALGAHKTRSQAVDQLRALYANEKDGSKAKAKPSKASDYALPDDKRLPINDRRHIGLAIAALGSDKNAPHGHAADLTAEDRATAKRNIRKKIGSLANDKNDAQELHDRLGGKKESPESFIEIDDYLTKDWSGMDSTGNYPMVNPYGDQGMDADDFLEKLDPDDPRVNYDAMGAEGKQGCANCCFFDADDTRCQLVCGDIVATGKCDLWLRELTDDEEDEQDAMPVEDVGGKSLLETVKTAIKQVFGLNDDPDTSQVDKLTGFKVFGPNNNYWAAIFSNNAKDRDGEWFSEKAHDKAIERLDAGQATMPYLDYWHSKAYHGQAFWVGREGHVVMAVGEFWPDEFSQAMKEYYANTAPEDDLVSFGYLYPRSVYVDRVYHDYTPFEISPLPSEVAANVWTGFASLVEFQEMGITAEKRKQLERRLGPALAKQLIAQAGEKSLALDKIETSFKETVDPLDEIRAGIKALNSAVLVLAGRKVKTDEPEVPTGRQGQPVDEEDQNNPEDEPDLDEEDDDNIGRVGKERRLEKQIAKLRRQLKAAKDDGEDDGDDDSEDDDGEDDDGEDNKKSRRRKARTPQTGLKELATGYKAISDSLTQVTQALMAINQKQAGLENGINQLAREIYSPTPASRSPYTQVPPDDPALASLKARMEGGPGQDTPPNMPADNVQINDMASFIGLPTAFMPGQNGNGRH